MATNRPPIAENLRRLKAEAGVTWKQIADDLGVYERQVLEWARPAGAGRYTASWETVTKLAAYFSEKLRREIDPGEFYRRPPDHGNGGVMAA